MAQRVITQILDDLDGSEAIGTFAFALDGYDYEIDLNKEHYEDLAGRLEPYVQVARRVSHKLPAPRSRQAIPSRKAELAEIRTWATNNGYNISDRGRVPVHVEQAWRER